MQSPVLARRESAILVLDFGKAETVLEVERHLSQENERMLESFSYYLLHAICILGLEAVQLRT